MRFRLVLMGAYIEEKMPDCSKDEYSKVIYQSHWDEMSALFDEYYDAPNNETEELPVDFNEKLFHRLVPDASSRFFCAQKN